MFDVGYSALIEDLDQRGLLDETLVVAVAEFGRTPKINQFGGRDHWGHVFSFALAGAGIARRTGLRLQRQDRRLSGLATGWNRKSLRPRSSTCWASGIKQRFRDRTGRPLPVTHGEPLWTLLGSQPATTERTARRRRHRPRSAV